MCVSYEYIEAERKKNISRKSHGKFRYNTNKLHKEKEAIRRAEKQNKEVMS